MPTPHLSAYITGVRERRRAVKWLRDHDVALLEGLARPKVRWDCDDLRETGEWQQ